MRKKDDLAIDKIMECAKTEFLEKGFEGASMRKVAENAGYTTGMLTVDLQIRANCSKR